MSLDLSETRRRLFQVPLIQSLPESLRERLGMLILWTSSERDLGPRQFLYLQGKQDIDTGCILLDGEVTVEKEGKMVKTIVAPDLMGEGQLFAESHERTATVRAATPTLALTFGWHDIGVLSAQVFTTDELQTIRTAIEQMAWERCAQLFDQAVESAQER